QVVKQLWKLFDVKKVALLSADDTVSREHLLVKMSVNNQTKATATEIINTYGGKIMDFWDDCVTVEITDNSDMIDQFIKQAEEIGILELCRSGCIAMLQGKANILNVKDLN
ncbi:MAG: acetolactate synthase small subunit, partial [Clostridiales bacterium]